MTLDTNTPRLIRAIERLADVIAQQQTPAGSCDFAIDISLAGDPHPMIVGCEWPYGHTGLHDADHPAAGHVRWAPDAPKSKFLGTPPAHDHDPQR